jgi:8-oxo-dGTP pyrophosphatase MutT (NUDIX family)
MEQCALREVEEETGLKKIHLGTPLLTTWHTYDENGKHILKETHWYRMKASSHQSIKPQEEEQITGLKWVGETGLAPILKNTFPSILDVLRAAGFNVVLK